jgi:hypothetical protein
MAFFRTQPVTPNVNKGATFYSDASVGASLKQLVAVNADRHIGVWVVNGTGGLGGVSNSGSGTQLQLPSNDQGNPNGVWIYGTGAIFVRTATPGTFSAYEI